MKKIFEEKKMCPLYFWSANMLILHSSITINQLNDNKIYSTFYHFYLSIHFPLFCSTWSNLLAPSKLLLSVVTLQTKSTRDNCSSKLSKLRIYLFCTWNFDAIKLLVANLPNTPHADYSTRSCCAEKQEDKS